MIHKTYIWISKVYLVDSFWIGENKVATKIIHKDTNASVFVEPWLTWDEKGKWKLDEYPIIYLDSTCRTQRKIEISTLSNSFKNLVHY